MPSSSTVPRFSSEKREDLLDLDISRSEALLADIQDSIPSFAPTAKPRLKGPPKCPPRQLPKKEEAYR
ncbi:unnamed protein product [Haemonchus placei]|uniref:Uncharacterized protein n=1 Tax=Haemonchus placei TaxID=6290 RepID=A0A0N4WXU1_HAEPC|nr:unnamed protein product [Haemonchus placei]